MAWQRTYYQLDSISLHLFLDDTLSNCHLHSRRLFYNSYLECNMTLARKANKQIHVREQGNSLG